VLKRVRQAKPVNEACAPFESPTTASILFADGVASHAAVKGH
jgi:hypothetical protein